MKPTVASGLILTIVLLVSCQPPAAPPSLSAKATVADRLAQTIDPKLNADAKYLLELYLHLHKNPELSLQEEKSGERMATELKALGFEVTTKVGGHGVVGVLKNGPGPTVLVRTDTDGLPVVEKTGVPYASTTTARDKSGNTVGVMHACGHDIHMTCWVGTARVLATSKDRWSGTLVFIAQPAEEIGAGARMMLDDGLFKKFPKPDFCLALHCDAQEPVGRIRYTEGLALANVDTVDVVVKGRGGHGAAPHTTVDPIVLAARIVLDLQTIVSREVNPTDPAVVTVGSIHGGTKHNIIPNEVKLQLTVRTTKDTVRDQVLKAIERICKAAATGANAPEPEFKVNLEEYTPSTINDVVLTKRIVGVLKQVIGEENVKERPPIMGGEDFGRYGRAGVPIFMYFLGTIAPDRYTEANRPGNKPLPSMHADGYFPAPEGSIQAGVRTMSAAVLELVGK